jgi:hypothetical protein
LFVLIRSFVALRLSAFALSAVVGLTGCGGGSDGSTGGPSAGGTTPPGGSTLAVASVSASPTTSEDWWGYSVQKRATALDTTGNAVNPPMTWSSSDSSVATVDPQGTVQLLRPGTADIRVNAGSATSMATVSARGFERLAQSTDQTVCALADGRQHVYCWGSSGDSAAPMMVGVPMRFNYVAPVAVAAGDIPAGMPISKVVVDGTYACALTDAGQIHCWGRNSMGQLGSGAVDAGRSAPQAVARGAVPDGVRFIDVDLQPNGACAIGDNGRLYCWGDHNPFPDPAFRPTDTALSPRAAALGDVPAGEKLTKVSVTTNGGCVLAESGRAYCWGSSWPRQPTLMPQGQVPTNVKLIDLQGNEGMPCALANDGQIYCWGTGQGRKFGSGQSAFVSNAAPTRVSTGAKPDEARFTAFTVGSIATTSCATADNGLAYCWGPSFAGSAGDGIVSARDILVPVEVLHGDKPRSFRWISVNCGRHTCAGLASDRRIYNWGFNQNATLSRENSVPSSPMPVVITRPERS